MAAWRAGRGSRMTEPAPQVSRHPVLTWTLWILRAARLVMLLLFVAYFVCVQVNAAAYLAGRNRPIVGGTVPPVPLGSDAAAVADIITGLVFEAIAALIVFIVVALFRAAIRTR
jgi:hypothetical protein